MTTAYQKYGKKHYEKNKENILKRMRKTYEEDPSKKSNYYFLKRREEVIKCRYGITLEGYNTLLNMQEGKCAICGTTETGQRKEHFHIDHCHENGYVRGLLCAKCNLGLGYFKDNPDFLKKAIDYLEKGGVCGL